MRKQDFLQNHAYIVDRLTRDASFFHIKQFNTDVSKTINFIHVQKYVKILMTIEINKKPPLLSGGTHTRKI